MDEPAYIERTRRRLRRPIRPSEVPYLQLQVGAGSGLYLLAENLPTGIGWIHRIDPMNADRDLVAALPETPLWTNLEATYYKMALTRPVLLPAHRRRALGGWGLVTLVIEIVIELRVHAHVRS